VAPAEWTPVWPIANESALLQAFVPTARRLGLRAIGNGAL